MRIQELEGIVGSDRATIRFYEKEGLITPNRSENGYRDYTPENAEELKKIRTEKAGSPSSVYYSFTVRLP